MSRGVVHSVPGGKLLEIPRDQDMGWKAAVTYNFDGGELWIQDRTGELDSDVKLPGWLVSEIFELILNSKKERQEYLYRKRDLQKTMDKSKPEKTLGREDMFMAQDALDKHVFWIGIEGKPPVFKARLNTLDGPYEVVDTRAGRDHVYAVCKSFYDVQEFAWKHWEI